MIIGDERSVGELWAAAHEKTQNPELIRQIKKDKQKFLDAVRQKWLQNSSRID